MDVASYQPGCVPDTARFFTSGNRHIHGFTLIELMVAVAILATLAGLAIPAFSNFISQQRQITSLNSLLSSLYLARSEAIMRNHDVMVCKSNDGQNCTRSGDWDQGWLIFEDRNADRIINDEEQIIAVHSAIPNLAIYYRAFGSNHYLVYRGNGMTKTNGTYTFCAPGGEATPRAIIVFKTGRPRSSLIRSDGLPLRCPP